MGWRFTDRQIKPVVKHRGMCRFDAKQKICPYFVARHNPSNNSHIYNFWCNLFDEKKTGWASVDACNAEYGRTYDGPPST